jgi:hypothetical protein
MFAGEIYRGGKENRGVDAADRVYEYLEVGCIEAGWAEAWRALAMVG